MLMTHCFEKNVRQTVNSTTVETTAYKKHPLSGHLRLSEIRAVLFEETLQSKQQRRKPTVCALPVCVLCVGLRSSVSVSVGEV